MKKPRCSVCGRTLKDPVSIAAGAGPVCRGASGGGHSNATPRARRHGGSTYGADAAGIAIPLPLGDLSQLFTKPQPVSKSDFDAWLEKTVSAETAGG